MKIPFYSCQPSIILASVLSFLYLLGVVKNVVYVFLAIILVLRPIFPSIFSFTCFSSLFSQLAYSLTTPCFPCTFLVDFVPLFIYFFSRWLSWLSHQSWTLMSLIWIKGFYLLHRTPWFLRTFNKGLYYFQIHNLRKNTLFGICSHFLVLM